MKEQKPLKLGIVGTSNIVDKAIIQPLKGMKGIIPYGIAGSRKEKAMDFAEKFHIEKCYDAYDALLEDEEIDCVYIPLRNDLHTEWIIKAIQANKHILVEKPICLKTKDLNEILAHSKGKDLTILEAVMVQFHPWQESVKQYIDEKLLGSLKKVETTIAFDFKEVESNYRSEVKYGGGCFYDLAGYWLQFLQSFTQEAPSDLKGHSDFGGKKGCDYTFDACLEWENGLTASAYFSFKDPQKAEHLLTFENGKILIKDFFRCGVGYHKFKFNILDMQNNVVETIRFDKENYYHNQLKYFLDAIKEGKQLDSMEKSKQRVELMEQIYLKAKADNAL